MAEDYLQFYRNALSSASSGPIARAALFAFNTNLDLVKRTTQKDAIAISRKHGLREFAERASKGEGTELSVSSDKLYALMSEGYDCERIGGQAGIMAHVSAQLGVRAYLHSIVVCKEITRHLNPNVFVSCPFSFESASAIMSNGEPPRHYVLDFGTDRLIASSDMQNSHMHINRNFKRCMEQEARLVEYAVVSGMHLLGIPEPKGKAEEIAIMLKRWRMRNPGIKIHFEMGHFNREDSLQAAAELVLPACNSVGFNASEAKQLARALGERGASEADSISAALEVCDNAVLHTSDYSVHASRKGKGARNGHAHQALALGNLLAGYLAASGEFPEPKALANFTFAVNDSLSRRRDFEKSWAFMPALKVAQPKASVGLGDCFTAGFSSVALKNEVAVSKFA